MKRKELQKLPRKRGKKSKNFSRAAARRKMLRLLKANTKLCPRRS